MKVYRVVEGSMVIPLATSQCLLKGAMAANRSGRMAIIWQLRER
jgi:hypothetical protein